MKARPDDGTVLGEGTPGTAPGTLAVVDDRRIGGRCAVDAVLVIAPDPRRTARIAPRTDERTVPGRPPRAVPAPLALRRWPA